MPESTKPLIEPLPAHELEEEAAAHGRDADELTHPERDTHLPASEAGHVPESDAASPDDGLDRLPPD